MTGHRIPRQLGASTIVVIVLVALAAIIVAGVIAWGVGWPNGARATKPGVGSSAQPTSGPSGSPSQSWTCPTPTERVSDAAGLRSALGKAKPGDVISLEPGRYVGQFVAAARGTAAAPITLCGTADSVLDGGGITGGYVIHLDHAAHWILAGFAVQNGQKGVMADGTTASVIRNLTVSKIGDEGIHLRAESSDNQVLYNTVRDTGLRKPKFGEGIYIGSAKSNWDRVNKGKPDASDDNLIQGNTVSHTTAENVDIKEGTTGGTIRDNTFDGTGMAAADSWVDVKGNGWTIVGNTGANSPKDGFQTHSVLAGWGTRNVFEGNTARLDSHGVGFALQPALQNILRCGNTVSGGGLSNVKCQG